MPAKKTIDTEESPIKSRFPANLSLRDLITIGATIVTITLAWGVFSTRLAIVEKELVTLSVKFEEDKSDMKDIKARVSILEHQINENEIFTDELYNRMKMPRPAHRFSRQN